MKNGLNARRDALSKLRYPKPKEGINAGLLLDKYVEAFKDEHAAEKKLYEFLMNSYGAPDCYNLALMRHCRSLKNDTDVVIIESKSRAAVGLGADSVLENSITLNRTYGAPMIPGSALKGLASHFCKTYYGGWQAEGKGQDAINVCTDLEPDDNRSAFLPSPESWHEAKHKSGPDKEKTEKEIKKYENMGFVDSNGYTYYDNLFGRQDAAGCIVFHDAWWIPTDKSPFLPDVMTVHHQDYYQADATKGDVPPPADYDSPNPIPFITLGSDVCFFVALEGAPGWRSWAKDILCMALEKEGIGAKTAIGYGRMRELPTNEWKNNDAVRRILTSDPAQKAQSDKLALEAQAFEKELSNAEVYEAILNMTDPDRAEFRSVLSSRLLKKNSVLKRISKRYKDCISNLKQWSKLDS